MTHLPSAHRPTGLNTRDFQPGIDLPRWFVDEVRSIDENLYFVWHPFRVIYDTVINQYTGSIEDPRFCIHDYGGQEVWGWPLTDNEGQPISENRWHIWRCSKGYGWVHVINVDSKEPKYLNLLVKRLHRNAVLSNMGKSRMLRAMQEEQEDMLQKDQRDGMDLWEQVQKENEGLMRSAYENFEFGRVEPTNATKDIITSYKGQSNRTKIERPYTDSEGGLILPEEWRSD